MNVLSVSEPLLEARDIQGNVLPGFRRQQQRLVAFRFDGSATAMRAALRLVLDSLTDLAAVLDHKDARKAAVLSGLSRPTSSSLWLNYALGVRAADALGLQRLRTIELAYDAGMPQRAGDTTTPNFEDGNPDPTCPDNWRVGGPNKAIDLFLIFAADFDIEALSAPLISDIEACGLVQIYAETGALLAEDKEHFGFRDGVSQPGVLGVVDMDGAQRFLMTRYNTPGTPGVIYGKPGQPLQPADQFIFGDDEAELRNGSFLVFRRLLQDVPGFLAETLALASNLTGRLGRSLSAEELRARIVGRWPSGQPLMRPVIDPANPESLMAINHFQFATDAPELLLNTNERVPAAAGDAQAQQGAQCPVWAHIRKVNPRDLQTNIGGPDLTRGRQMLRRGIPFGAPYNFDEPNHTDNARERGLLFLAYQRSITDQFEQLNGNWMNSSSGPMDGGFDLLVGQNLENGRHGRKEASYYDAAQDKFVEAVAMKQWVKPTGGEYLFAPSVSWTRQVTAA